MTRCIFSWLLAVFVILALPLQGAWAASGPGAGTTPAVTAPTVQVVSVKPAERQKERFDFVANTTGIDDANRSQYAVSLQLARTNGTYRGDDVLAMVWDGSAWTLTRSVRAADSEGKRKCRVIVTKAGSREIIATSEDFTFKVGERITRQEVETLLGALADAYINKDYRRFMSLVSPDFAGDDFLLANAIRKDFQVLNSVTIRFTVNSLSSTANYATASVFYQRAATPTWDPTTLRDSGVTEMGFEKDRGVLKLYSLKKPLLFGLSNGGQVATGIVQSGQNSSVLQIGRNGAPYVGPIGSTRPTARSVSLQGNLMGFEALRVNSGIKTSGNISVTTMDGNVGIQNVGTVDFQGYLWINMSTTKWRPLLDAADINTVTTVPDQATYFSNYGQSFAVVPSENLVYALYLPATRTYALVQFSNWVYSGAGSALRATATYKYQSDGTRNF